MHFNTPLKRLFGRPTFCAWIIITLAAIVAGFDGTAVQAQTRHAIVFAPGQYPSLPGATYHALAAKGLPRQLERCGFQRQQMRILTGPAATQKGLDDAIEDAILSVSPGDIVVLIAQSYGIHSGGADYLASYATELAADGSIAGEAIDVAALVRNLADITDTQQMILIDGHSHGVGIPEEAAARFGRALPVPAAGQVIAVGREGKLITRGKVTLTAFSWSLFDGLDSHADRDRSGTVSAQELTRYASDFAADARVSAPRIAGKLSGNESLFLVTSPEQTRYADQLNLQARRLAAEAMQALHLELDAKAAINLLDRAKRLCRDDQIEASIDDSLLSADVLYRGFDAVFAPSVKPERSWQLIIEKPTRFYVALNPVPVATLEIGTVVRIDRRQGTWLEVESVRRPVVDGGTLRFADVSLPPDGFVRTSDFRGASSQVVPSEYLKNQLVRIQSPAGTLGTNASEE
ncbi:hypothetical protein Mal15_48550 [Stieleria maiorica]|uniref:EF-hand domain-containing protein n=1 Tax=Stieleria maiorica TaxID=2795974 RepID=A0A5B9MHL9_9BACT|nr:hypothetical protein [Stieleria maiorica]QEG00783.1 hypothetical protein Mal15_48550 [Stieleria maiorica]